MTMRAKRRQKRPSGASVAFILLEMLVVVALIAILAAIAVPNFMEAQTRAKIARTHIDMAVLQAALRAYGAQYDAYPPNAPARPLLESGWDLAALTTPIAWLSLRLPIDPFNESGRSPGGYGANPDWPFIYINRFDALREDGQTTTVETAVGYLLLSFGPDEQLTLPHPVFGPFIPYDPTNGTDSPGDLFLTGR
jgi:type II secretory pathway pseudopilin PulG